MLQYNDTQDDMDCIKIRVISVSVTVACCYIYRYAMRCGRHRVPANALIL